METTTPQRSAIVTGASSGIGRHIATMLCTEGYAVTLAARSQEQLDEAAAELARAGHDVIAVRADVRSDADLEAVVRRHQERYGRLDVLVNNAGVGIDGPLRETTVRQIDRQLSVNLRGTILLTHACLPLLTEAGAEHGQAWVVNTASAAGKDAMPRLATYSAAKHGVVGFSDALNRELAGSGVRVCALCPGYVDTPLADYAREWLPGEEMIQTADLAEATRFLLRLSRHCVVPEISFLRPGLVP
jgi:NAD(P)-dependent dehydrogenase (short-subunit alcohol dehydrogenase family)